MTGAVASCEVATKELSSGVMGTSGLTTTPSGRTAKRMLLELMEPTESPEATGPALSVASRTSFTFELLKASVKGHKPTEAAIGELNRNSSQWLRARKSALMRTATTLSYLDDCMMSPHRGMQYTSLRPAADMAAAMVSRKASGSVRLKSV